MLRSACSVCRSLLLSHTVDEAAWAKGLQYAACSIRGAPSRSLNLALAASNRRLATEGGAGIVIDDTAVRRLQELQAEAQGKPVMLRVEVEGGGCSGFQYRFRLDDSTAAAEDMVFERDGVRVVCDAVSLDFLRGAVLEYEDSLMRSAFQVRGLMRFVGEQMAARLLLLVFVMG
eukprot:GHRQ01015153.1.p2 GENE.GHRQ01015153.1~~GHRQ01015153.1.p2  ORF type:complete len:174 (+),score=47.24 GHRQ01015153.1:214-735(+)